MGFVVVGIDGSNAARSAFHEAVREARWRESEIVALHVVVVPRIGTRTIGHYDLGRLEQIGQNLLSHELDEVSQRYDNAIPADVEPRVAVGHPGAEIIRTAEGDNGDSAELVVLGSRGLGGFAGLLLGSTTTYATHHLPGRLLIVGAPNDS